MTMIELNSSQWLITQSYFGVRSTSIFFVCFVFGLNIYFCDSTNRLGVCLVLRRRELILI